MYRTIFTSIIILFSLPCSSSDSYYFEYTPEFQTVYNSIIELKLNLASNQLRELKQKDKYNLAIVHMENYLDFFELFIQEDESLLKLLDRNKKKRIGLLKKHLSDDNPYKKYCIAEINLQCSLARSKFGSVFKSARELYYAYSNLKENQSKFPDFYYNKKSLSIIHALIETLELPGIFKSLLGIEGSIELAKKEILDFIDWQSCEGMFFKAEADAIYSYILSYQLMHKEEAWIYIKQSSLDPSKSLLANFLIAQLAQQIGSNDAAIEVLSAKPLGKDYSKFHYLNFMLGVSKLRSLDPTATYHLKEFVSEFNGRHYIKEAYQKLAWSSLIFDNDSSSYFKYMKMVEKEGQSKTDGDKQALQEFKKSKIPNSELLKSRVLFDGGYYKRSLEVLDAFDDNLNQKHRYELLYRKARIYHKLNLLDEAILYYKEVLLQKKDKSNYIYCNSELQLGLIHEEKMEWEKAIHHFEMCLNLSPITYKRSLHQKARSGIDRLEKW